MSDNTKAGGVNSPTMEKWHTNRQKHQSKHTTPKASQGSRWGWPAPRPVDPEDLTDNDTVDGVDTDAADDAAEGRP